MSRGFLRFLAVLLACAVGSISAQRYRLCGKELDEWITACGADASSELLTVARTILIGECCHLACDKTRFDEVCEKLGDDEEVATPLPGLKPINWQPHATAAAAKATSFG
ncbi:hypothetical protein AAVH_27345 [Aphelenchoides avenae]|nr:hypothetical protein AAVH_27345 [Aphelenchus avenae]